MARLLEATVQDKAIDYLEDYYKSKARRGNIYAQKEVRTKNLHGNKRADGLIAYKNWFWGTYVVAIEAKSFKTLPAIKPYFKKWLFIKNIILAGLALSLMTGTFFALFKMHDQKWQYILPLTTFTIGAVLYGLFSYSSYRNRSMDVIDQIKQYPGNEQWLALSQDSLDDLSNEQYQELMKICKGEGVGLIIVKPKNRIVIAIKPRKQVNWFGDYLKYYSTEDKIKQYLDIS